MRAALAAMGFAACLAAPGSAAAQDRVADPWEETNRDLFAAHEAVDKAVLEPIARGYRAATPGFARQGVLNFLRNLRAPVIFANDLLQGEGARAGVTAARFGVNTTIGVAGLFDPATSLGLERHDEDFGQTLAVWGVAPGPYLFVPLLGPTNVRDGAGRIIDIAFDPLTWATFEEADAVRAGRTVTAGVAARETVIEAVEDVRRDALDPYVSIRTSYALLRASAIENGRANVQDLPEFEPIPGAPDASAPEPPATPDPDEADDASEPAPPPESYVTTAPPIAKGAEQGDPS